MKGAIRIRHHWRRNQTHVVPLPHKPFPRHEWSRIPECGECLRNTGRTVTHYTETYHLHLDHNGCVLVGPPVIDDLKRMPNMAQYRIENHVPNPPPLTLTPPTAQARIRGISFADITRRNDQGQYGRIETDLDGYVDYMNAQGKTTEEALKLLLAYLVGVSSRPMTPQEVATQEQNRANQRVF